MSWKTVPVDPQKEQIDAALKYEPIISHGTGVGRALAAAIYRDMVAAAPAPQVIYPNFARYTVNTSEGVASDAMYSGKDVEALIGAALARYGIK